MLDALYAAWQADIDDGQDEPHDRPRLGTVAELNARARADRIAAGHVAERASRRRRRRRPGWVTWS